jgi:hypothetical protein
MQKKPNLTARRIRRLGAVILLAGLVAAPTIYFTSPPEEKLGILGIDIRTKRERNQLERMGGSNYVLLKDFDDWFGSLWHGRKLGGTVAVLSVLGFLLCRGLAYVEEDFARDEAKRLERAKEPGQSHSQRAVQ